MKNVIIKTDQLDKETLLYKEWLVVNGIGGFACGSISGVPMRKYHSLLNAALSAPFGRTIMFNHVADEFILNEKPIPLTTLATSEETKLPNCLKEFRLENGIPFWTYEVDDVVIEKSLFLIHGQNTLCMSYKLISSKNPIEIKWRPYFHFRTNQESLKPHPSNESYTVHAKEFRYEIEYPSFPVLRIFNESSKPFTIDSHEIKNVYYDFEAKRGYESIEDLQSPGYFSITLTASEKATFKVSTESWEILNVLSTDEAHIIEKVRKRNLLKRSGIPTKNPTLAKLTLAADQFLITPITRYQDMVRLRAAGEEVRSIIAGFPWFTDWGRDTMISLEGLTLCTGRSREAYAILNTFSHYIKDGLIPNMFPDGKDEGIYNTADATLWYFHAIDRYIEVTRDDEILEFLLPKLREVMQYLLKGTKFGIKADKDGLLIQGYEGLQLTWMDAKVDDWVVTPRRGKAVEINGLWYNALKLFEKWTGKPLEITQQCYESFNKKFWFEEGQYLYDVIEGEKGNDSSLRPNQLFAISLKHPVLEPKYWKPVFSMVEKELLTPLGLRTLSPSHPDYKPTYDGDLRTRDAAYHQGTVWPWLLGPFIDVLLKVHPDNFERAREILKGLEDHLNYNCLGTIGEIFDSSQPYHSRGCFAQAWSVAEFLRSLIKILPKDQTD